MRLTLTEDLVESIRQAAKLQGNRILFFRYFCVESQPEA